MNAPAPDSAIADETLRVRDASYATEHYDDAYYDWILKNKQFRSHHLRMSWIKQLVDPRSGDRIVDLGCGPGVVAEFLARHGAAVHGVDLHPKAVATARKVNAAHPACSFQVGDASSVPNLADGSFDKAVSCDVTEHCGYDVMLGIFREAHRLLKPGGTYFIYTPNPKHWIEKLKEWGIMKGDPTHTGLRTGQVIVEALEKCGFEVTRHPSSSSMFPVINALEWLWRKQPVLPQLANYRVIVLARKPGGPTGEPA
jgi:2-polyprenyl-3-methyl-5-hydroxy-6-metoxy-1,4-benzoquinol methylase